MKMVTVEITTFHIVIVGLILVYLIGVFVARFVCGIHTPKPYDIDDLDSCFSLLWPILLPIIIIETGASLIRWILNKSPNLNRIVKASSNLIVSILDVLTLPLRPFTLGQRIVQWRKDKERNKPQQVPWSHRNNWIVRIKRWVKSLFNNTTSYKK